MGESPFRLVTDETSGLQVWQDEASSAENIARPLIAIAPSCWSYCRRAANASKLNTG